MTQFKRFKIRNFKSIKEIDFKFSQLNILIGMNGAGKSTILQALDFISQLMHSNSITTWLESRDWKPHDLNCKLLKESNIEVEVEVELDNQDIVIWVAQFNRASLKCTNEKIMVNQEEALISKSRELTIPIFIGKINTSNILHLDSNEKTGLAKFHTIQEYEGSILSTLSIDKSGFNFVFRKELLEFRAFLRNIKSLELLAPHLMRKSTRTNEDDHVGIGGEKLSSYLFKLNEEQKENLIGFLKNFYPNIIDFKTKNQRSGWKKLIIQESTSIVNIEHEARHINDGLLRILAILAQLQSTPSFLMLDEIENGVNQEIIEKLVNILLNSKTQLLITTHSPLVLNYLPDDVAKDAVNYVYKSSDGDTQYKRFFEIPRVNEKLEFMGVGDAVLDTNLIELTNTLNSVE